MIRTKRAKNFAVKDKTNNVFYLNLMEFQRNPVKMTRGEAFKLVRKAKDKYHPNFTIVRYGKN